MSNIFAMTSSQVTILASTLSAAFVVIVAVLVFVLVKFWYIPRKYRKQIKELESKYYYLDALFRGQDSQFVHRLENISRTNLLYVDKYNDFATEYKHIMDFDDHYAEGMVKQLNALLANKQYKTLKQNIADVTKAVSVFETSVNEFDAKLLEVIKPEEESRKKILGLKETYRGIKQIYYASSGDLELVSASFVTIFDKLDARFKEFDDYIDSAQYDEANALLPTLEEVLYSLDTVLKDLPNLCILVEKIIPDQIKAVTAKYNELEKKEIPTFHLNFKNSSREWNNELKNLKEKLRDLDISNVARSCEKIQKEIENLSNQISEEETDRDLFNEKNEEIYRQVNELDSRFIKVVALLPDVEQVYSIDSEELEKIENLKSDINKVAAAKRDLDTIVHSTTTQPYSVLYHKLDELETDFASASQGLDDFTHYLDSLKANCESAYSLMFDYFYKAKELEEEIRSLSMDNVFATYKDEINQCYTLIDDLNKVLQTIPINVGLVNSKLEELKNIATDVFSAVSNLCHEAKLAESSIVYANRDRNRQNDVHTQLVTLEKEFYAGNFEDVYHNANKIYRARHVEDASNGGH